VTNDDTIQFLVWHRVPDAHHLFHRLFMSNAGLLTHVRNQFSPIFSTFVGWQHWNPRLTSVSLTKVVCQPPSSDVLGPRLTVMAVDI
jgi:hypothetical protein